ncbi:hypothetical protein GCM10023195_05290 [Actinoallomurus liliacearum]|uniref:Uncharacterized protein n=1 Tax=Actinoallomurus liliacearum TaxID=1080073 RepID=A0ABP8TDL4_9ACTN
MLANGPGPGDPGTGSVGSPSEARRGSRDELSPRAARRPAWRPTVENGVKTHRRVRARAALSEISNNYQ